ncbi:MAG TPA: LytTR family DNA-binding domain-containing protein, partial [bacterium]|nr:LytTR family DNA-binding domain-containing protein [bacterium]
DLVFLDIQMPDLDGFTAISRIDADRLPFIVFVTAYDRYALRAFDVHAVDYLLKPFSDERFHEALDRVRTQLSLQRSSELRDKLSSLIREYHRDQGAFVTALPVRRNGALIEVPTGQVRWIESTGNYVTLYTEGSEELVRITMNALESELDPDRFLRIHRRFLVNLDHVTRLHYLNDGRYRVELTDGTRLASGRSFKPRIAEVAARR